MAPNLTPVPTSEKPAAPSTTGASAQLKQIATDSEKRVAPQFINAFHRLMAAGKKAEASPATYENGTKKYLDSIPDIGQVPDMIAHGVVKLLTVIHNDVVQKGGQFPIEPVALAGQMFMVDGLEYLLEERQMPIDTAVIDQTTLATKDGVLMFIKSYGKTTLKLNDEQVNQGMTGQHEYAKQGAQPGAAPTGAPQPAAPVEGEGA